MWESRRRPRAQPSGSDRRDQLHSGIIISNGLNRFPLADAAAEFARTGQLDALIMGGYPKGIVRHLARVATRSDRVVRMLARRKQIPDSLVKSCWVAELLGQTAAALRALEIKSLPGWVDTAAFRTFSWQSRNRIARERTSATFLYRSGFGLSAVAEARRRGMLTVCYHSAAHPNFLQRSRLLGGDSACLPRPWSLILSDLSLADAVIVEGAFVKRTFLEEGWPESRLHVVYEGVDDAFLRQVPERVPHHIGGPLQLLFVGVFGRWKGAEDIILALDGLSDVDWRLTIAGSIKPEDRNRFRYFLERSNVEALGIVSRAEVAARMAAADVFVFPSLAEGSARVVFEALASGCYVITTPNAGSIVEDGIHGAIVSIRAPDQIAAAIRHAAGAREKIRVIGDANAKLVVREYRQTHFASALWQILCELHATRGAAQ